VKKDLAIDPIEYELIEASLENSLSDKMKAEFEERGINDLDWSLKIAEVKSLRDGVEKLFLKEELKSIHQELFSRKQEKTTNISLWILGLAAGFVLLLIASSSFFGLFQSKNERLFQAYYETDAGLIAAMSESDNYEFDRGMVDFKSGEYNTALTFWDPLLKADNSNDTLLYFVAIANIEVKEYKISEKLLKELVANSNSHFQRDAKWNLALLYLKKGDISASENLLLTIKTHEAAQLLKEIK